MSSRDSSRQPLVLNVDEDDYTPHPLLSDRGTTYPHQHDEEVDETVIGEGLPEAHHGQSKGCSYYYGVLRAYLKANMNRESIILLTYLVCLVLIGTSNRVTFKLMQYATMNYGYFISQLTTFIYLPVNFGVILFKLLFTNDISPNQRNFPWYKFLVMGTLDSMQGLLIVVGGIKVPGIMQNLLMQGAVPVTMLFSIFLLRNRGCDRCLEVKKILANHDVHYKEESGAKCNGPKECGLTIDIHGVAINRHLKFDAADVIRDKDNILFEGFLDRDSVAEVVVRTSATPWSKHFKTYYTIPQYIGAMIILFGLVVSVWPAFQKSNNTGDGPSPGGPPLWDLIFFSANIPTALSGVYKEIAFRTVEDMDVWWLNGWVALWQFTIGLSYAPLAAVMSGLEISLIPQNMVQGFECVFEAHNTIVLDPNNPNCAAAYAQCINGSKHQPHNHTNASSTSSSYSSYGSLIASSASYLVNPMADNPNYPPCPCNCLASCSSGKNATPCCDSCNGKYPAISDLPAWAATLMYMGFNIAYNVFLVLVIKHGSAALMYIASTVVLPLGSVAFTSKALLGVHAQPFNAYDGAGLGVVLLGLIVYRFLGSRKRPISTADMADMAMGNVNFTFTDAPVEPVLIRPATNRELRNRLYGKLGLNAVQPPTQLNSQV